MPSQNKGKGKSSYDKWSNEEQSFLVDLWAEKHDRLENKDAKIAWQEIENEKASRKMPEENQIPYR